ncbi:MAG: hypothetical protein PHO91_00095 [Patescibacteria group bacterium]|nr:hypothetical protein [Patescibacteria group bacterium]
MKLFETKIYFKFISWFILVSLLPLCGLFVAVYFFEKDSSLIVDVGLRQAIIFGVLISLALVFMFSLIAARRLARVIVKPIQKSAAELLKVTDELFKSIQSLSDISQSSSQLSGFLLLSSQEQERGIKEGNSAVVSLASSLKKISKKTQSSAAYSSNIDQSASEGAKRSQAALDGLVLIKNLATENQKLNQALDNYTVKTRELAEKMSALADLARFLSLNVSIEANKTDFSEEFSSLVAQIRELNASSKQAAAGVDLLASDMQRQIKQARQSSVYEWKETEKSIRVLGETLVFLNNILGDISVLSKDIKTIDKESSQSKAGAENISAMIKNISKEAKAMVQKTDDVTTIVHRQLVVTRALNRSSFALTEVVKSLDDLLGERK